MEYGLLVPVRGPAPSPPSARRLAGAVLTAALALCSRAQRIAVDAAAVLETLLCGDITRTRARSCPPRPHRGVYKLTTEQAKSSANLARSRVLRIGHAMTTAMTLMTEAMLGTIGGNIRRAADHADELIAHSQEHSFSEYEIWGQIFQGILTAQCGDTVNGIHAARRPSIVPR